MTSAPSHCGQGMRRHQDGDLARIKVSYALSITFIILDALCMVIICISETLNINNFSPLVLSPVVNLVIGLMRVSVYPCVHPDPYLSNRW